MTATRFGRAGRSRFFIGFGAFVMIIGFVIIKLQLDEARKIELRREKQLEDLEEKLKLEREQCEQLKYNLEIQSQKQDEIKERSVQEANTKLTTLQQHYKLLKNQFEDFKEECSRIKSTQIDKINSLQTSLNSFKEPNTCGEKDKEIKSWKTKYFELLNGKTISKQHDIRPTREATKDVVAVLKNEVENRPTQATVMKNFNAQIAVSDKLYAISIKYNNNNNTSTKTIDHDEEINIKAGTAISSPINQAIASQSKASSTTENIRNSIQIEQKLMKFPLGVVPFVQPNIIDPAVQSSENIQHGNQKSFETLKRLQKENGEDIGAREENDSNYFVAEEQIHNNHMPNEDQANDKLKKGKGNKLKAADVPNINDDDLQVVQQANDILENNRNKLKNEVNEDQGKAYADEMNFQVEDEDDDEYADHRGHLQGQAVRER